MRGQGALFGVESTVAIETITERRVVGVEANEECRAKNRRVEISVGMLEQFSRAATSYKRLPG